MGGWHGVIVKKPNNLSSVEEDDWTDVFLSSYLSNKISTSTAAYATWAQLLRRKIKKAFYLSMTGTYCNRWNLKHSLFYLCFFLLPAQTAIESAQKVCTEERRTSNDRSHLPKQFSSKENQLNEPFKSLLWKKSNIQNAFVEKFNGAPLVSHRRPLVTYHCAITCWKVHQRPKINETDFNTTRWFIWFSAMAKAGLTYPPAKTEC